MNQLLFKSAVCCSHYEYKFSVLVAILSVIVVLFPLLDECYVCLFVFICTVV